MAPVLVPNAGDSVAPVLAVAMLQHQSATEYPTAEWAAEAVPYPLEFALFLAHHQLLI